jgi:hypothetical protein
MNASVLVKIALAVRSFQLEDSLTMVLHAGGEIRNTSVTLVMAFFKWSLSLCGDTKGRLFRHIGIFLDIRVAELLVSDVSHLCSQPFEKWREEIASMYLSLDWAIEFLKFASNRALKISKRDPLLKGLLDMATNIHVSVMNLVKLMTAREATTYRLPELNTVFGNPDSFRNPILSIPTGIQSASSDDSDDFISERNMVNIGFIPDPPELTVATYNEVMMWVKELIQNPTEPKNWTSMKGIEQFLFKKAMNDLETNVFTTFSDDEITKLESIVDEYRRLLHKWRAPVESGHDMMTTELRSREMDCILSDLPDRQN